jgi:hypothetical protein
MKSKSSELLFLTFFISVVSAFAAVPNVIRYNAGTVSNLEAQKIKIDIEIPKAKVEIIDQTTLFLTSIGRRESSNRYNVVNKWGYMGKYQFGRKTLNALGYENISNKQFLNNPKLQEEAMVKLLKHNKHILRREIRKYCGTQKHGVYITESGLLAAAHLAGPGNVKKWLRRGKRFRDGLGTDLVEYLKLFGNYKINI